MVPDAKKVRRVIGEHHEKGNAEIRDRGDGDQIEIKQQ
jgi:hypothetical protein